MNHRERVLMALDHEEPDRVPLDLGGCVTSIHEAVYDRLKEFLDIEAETIVVHYWQRVVLPDEKILREFDIDTRHVYPGIRRGGPKKELADGSYLDGWGVKRKLVGYYYDITSDGHPLSGMDMEDLERYNWPDPQDAATSVVDEMEERARYLHEKTDYAVVLDTSLGFFEQSWYMRGFEGFLVDLLSNPQFACKLMSRIADYKIKFNEEILGALGDYVDIVTAGDDLSMQDGPIISPKTYKKYVKPYQKRVFDAVKRKSDAKIFYHTCGSARIFYQDLSDVGVDIINPIQVSAKDMGNTKELKEEYGDELCFWGAIDTQRVLPFGTPKDVGQEVRRRIGDLAPGGGYVLCAVHNIQPRVSPENICAMYKAAMKYGKYAA